MSAVPPAFRHRLHSHNFHVMLGSLISLLAAILVWVALYHAGYWLTLAALTSVRGIEAVAPENYDQFFAAGVVLLMVLAGIDRVFHPYSALRDRPILGWHLLREVPLIPACLTLSVSENLRAYRKLTRSAVARCWLVLVDLVQHGPLPQSKISRLGLRQADADAALLTLQLCGFVDLHRAGEGWFFRIRSSQEPTVRGWMTAATGH